MSLLDVDRLVKSFPPDAVNVINEVSFGVNRHEIFALLGPSGCGKTTTLRVIAGFEHADRGRILLNNRLLGSGEKHTPPEKRGIGFVFQDYALFPHLSVMDNVMFGLRHCTKEECYERAHELVCMMGLREHQHYNPHELSGGQQQRVALARAIAPRPELILLDEPMSNLDAVLRQSTRDEVRTMLKNYGMSALLVTHDQEEALSFADRIAVMNNGQIEQVGTPEEVYYRPKTQFVAQFLGRTNLITAQAEGETADTDIGRLPLHENTRGRVLLSIRPEHLTLEPPQPETNGDSGEVITREFKGHDITYRVRIRTRECLVHTDNRVLFNPGDRVTVRPLEPAVVLENIQVDLSHDELRHIL